MPDAPHTTHMPAHTIYMDMDMDMDMDMYMSCGHGRAEFELRVMSTSHSSH